LKREKLKDKTQTSDITLVLLLSSYDEFHSRSLDYFRLFILFSIFNQGERGRQGEKGQQGQKGMPGTCEPQVVVKTVSFCSKKKKILADHKVKAESFSLATAELIF